MRQLVLLSALLLSSACRPDDVDDTGAGATSLDGGGIDGGGADGGGTDGGTAGDAGTTAAACADSSLLGTWLSEGADVSPLFTSVDYDSVQATFGSDCSYQVLAVTGAGDSYDINGTWSADEGTDPATIVQTQAQPYEATADGIWQIVGDTLTFEVVQTDPDYGFTAPTPTSGFGSTAGQGLSAGDNTQTYQRQ